jgi:hypothetical protein
VGALPTHNPPAGKHALTVLVSVVSAALTTLIWATTAVAAPTAVGAQTATSDGTSVSVATPAGTVAGDVLVGTVTSRDRGAVTFSAPNGWTFVRRDTCTMPGAELTQGLYIRTASSIEPASTEWTLDRHERSSAAVVAYRGVDGGAPLVAHSGELARDTTTATAPSVTTTGPDTLLVGSFGRSDSSSVSEPSGTSQRYTVANAGAVSTFGLDFVRAVAGATGSVTTTSIASSDCAIAQLLALMPAPSIDLTPPSAPGAFRATGATQTAIDVAWSPSTDNVGVSAYDLFRDSAAAGSTASTTASFTGLTCGRSYSLGVEARDAAGNRSARSTITASTAACTTQPPPPPGTGTTLTYTDTYWRCSRPVRDYATSGLPLRVVMRFTGNYVPPSGGGVVQLGTGCLGDGTNATDLVLDIQGDGRTYGGGDDAIRVMNALPGASNLQIEGRANCGGRVAAAHQDGIQVLGGTNITFRNFEIGNYDAGLATCQGAGGAFFYSLNSSNTRVEGGKYIACNHSLFAGAPFGHVSGASFRSGRIDGTDPVCIGYFGSNPCMGPEYGTGVTVSGLTCQFWNRTAHTWDAR